MLALEKRKTHQYVGQWKHLDDWETIGRVDELTTRDVTPEPAEDECDPCDPRNTEIYAFVKSDAPDDEISKALKDTYTSWGCDHEWDCCGCRNYAARSAKRVGGDLWCIEVYSSRNY